MSLFMVSIRLSILRLKRGRGIVLGLLDTSIIEGIKINRAPNSLSRNKFDSTCPGTLYYGEFAEFLKFYTWLRLKERAVPRQSYTVVAQQKYWKISRNHRGDRLTHNKSRSSRFSPMSAPRQLHPVSRTPKSSKAKQATKISRNYKFEQR